jgi:hypothetical protein
MSEAPEGTRYPAYHPRATRRVRVPWSALREIGNAPAVRLTIAIPLVGYLILFNENLLHYVELSRELFGQTQRAIGQTADRAHVSWRLLALYFGLCSIAAGATLHAIFCPGEIKSYRLPSDYIAIVLPNLSSIAAERIEEALIRGDALAKSQIEDWRDIQSSRPIPQTEEQWQDKWTETHRGVLDLYFSYLDRQRPAARISAAVCYSVGFFALAIPSIDVFVRVVALLFKAI